MCSQQQIEVAGIEVRNVLLSAPYCSPAAPAKYIPQNTTYISTSHGPGSKKAIGLLHFPGLRGGRPCF